MTRFQVPPRPPKNPECESIRDFSYRLNIAYKNSTGSAWLIRILCCFAYQLQITLEDVICKIVL